jgi:hypothetical protein
MARVVDLPTAMGYHLWADTRHDFGAGAPIYNIRGTNAPGVNGAPVGAGPEAQGLNYFLSGDGRALIDDYTLRTPNIKIFAVPEKTNAFQAWTPPSLYTTGNSAVGVIQDAGHYITDILGAKNVLTFGSVLDPATKPAGAERSPIWFDPSENTVRIPLAMFGFAPASIEALEVSRFAGGVAVSANYIVGGASMDAIALGPDQPRPGVKPISKTDVGLAGFFTSIAKAENLPAELTASEVFPTDADARDFVATHSNKFFIGKTLGDVTLVASAMNNFSGTPNPYTGIGTEGTWKDINNNATAGPETLILKTGDQLNWVRAIVMGVGAIYEDQPKGVRSTLQYKFFPATLSDEQLRVSLTNGFDAIAADVTDRYDSIRRKLGDILAGGADGILKVNETAVFVGEMQSVLTREPGKTIGAEVVQQIQSDLEYLKTIVVNWVNLRRTTINAATSLDDLRGFYEDTRVKSNACAPTARSIFIEKSGQQVIPMKIIITNVPPSAIAADPDWPLTVSIDLAMRQAFGKLNIARDMTGGLVGTDLKKRFFDKIEMIRAATLPAGGQRGGAVDTILNYAETMSPNLKESRKLPLIVGEYAFALNPLFGDPDEAKNLFHDCPRIQSFATYLITLGKTTEQVYEVIDNIANWKSAPACIDEGAAAEIAKEWNTVQARGDIFVTARPVRESRDTMLFNAFVCCVNARNSRGFGALEYEDTTSERDFRLLEIAFISAYSQTPTRVPTVETSSAMKRPTGTRQRMEDAKNYSEVYAPGPTADYTAAASSSYLPQGVAAAGAPQYWSYAGGLRDRRSLYTKHVGGSSPAPRRGLYAGLRERVGPRTTRRIRQRTGKSHTRRQRKHLDRI